MYPLQYIEYFECKSLALFLERARVAHLRTRTVSAAYGNTGTHFLRTFWPSTRTTTQRLLDIIKKLNTFS